MPQCKAKFCKVKRGQGLSTFQIPDPQKNKELWERWIHNLGNKKLNKHTYVFSTNSIVCERHFEKDCFVEDLQAKYLGYEPTRKCLKPDAEPTIFDDSKERKRRIFSEKRAAAKSRAEMLEKLLATYPSDKTTPSDKKPSTSGTFAKSLPKGKQRMKNDGNIGVKKPKQTCIDKRSFEGVKSGTMTV